MLDSVLDETRSLAGERLLMVGLDWPAVDTALQLGLDVTVICSRAIARGGLRDLDGVKVLLVEDNSRLDDCLAALALDGSSPQNFDGVYSTDEFALGACNALAALAGSSRLTTTGDVTAFRDKRYQKSVIRAAGIPTAEFWPIDDLTSFDPTLVPWPAKYVLKPASRAGAMHTKVVKDLSELRAALDELVESESSDKDFLLEEHIDVAKEWVADGVVHDGCVEFLSISHYGSPPLQSLTADLPMTMVKLDREQAPDEYAVLGPFVEASLAALGAWRGVFHMEIFWSPSAGFVFGESALRRGGAFTYEQMLEKYGFSIVEAAIRCALGHAPQKPGNMRPGVVGTTQLLSPQGTVLRVPELVDFEQQAGVRFARYFLGPGSVLQHGSAHGTHIRTAEALIVASDMNEFDDRVRRLQLWFHEQVEVAPLADNAVALRKWQRDHFVDARRSESTYGVPPAGVI